MFSNFELELFLEILAVVYCQWLVPYIKVNRSNQVYTYRIRHEHRKILTLMTCSAVSVSHFFSLYLSPIPKDSFAGNLNCAQVRELHNWDPVCLKNLHILRYLNCAALDVSAAPSLLGCVVVQVQYKSTKSTKSTHNNHQTRKIAENC